MARPEHLSCRIASSRISNRFSTTSSRSRANFVVAVRRASSAWAVGATSRPRLLTDHDAVFGAEINPAMVAMLRASAGESPILDDPRVQVAIGDGRSLFAAQRIHCRVLQASLVDTWAATAAGAFAHTESTLYTREAWAIFLDRVEPDGLLTFSRWYDPRNVGETARLLSLAIAALLDRGVVNPRDHLALVAAGRVATVLLSPAPLSDDDRAALDDAGSRLGFGALAVPGRPIEHPLLRAIGAARSITDLGEAGTRFALDTTPPTDDRPFFFQLQSPRAWLHPVATVSLARHSSGVLAGNTTATLALLVTFLVALGVGVGLLAPTVVHAVRMRAPSLPNAFAVSYFGALGAGFMVAEIALVQRMHVLLGHPTYALVAVLAGLLVATGVGSMASGVVVRSARQVGVVALVAAAMLFAAPTVIHAIARATIGASTGTRMACAAACAAVLGVAMGMLFPSGLRFLPRGDGTPLALAINGVASVLGSVGAMLISVWFGIPASFACAGSLYVLAAVSGPARWGVDGARRSRAGASRDNGSTELEQSR